MRVVPGQISQSLCSNEGEGLAGWEARTCPQKHTHNSKAETGAMEWSVQEACWGSEEEGICIGKGRG